MTFKKYIIIIVTTFLFSNSLFAETITKQLTTLNNLYKEGAITEEEFSKAKKILLESDTKGKTKIEDEKKVDEKKKKKIKKVKNYNEDLSKTFISLDELDQIGKYKKIEIVPEGMFKIKMSEEGRSKKAMEEMANTFIKKKGLMEKYPENTMKAMGYFEIFYMQTLKDEKKNIEKFKKNYPNISKTTRKSIKNLYSLNQARKSMRESIGLTLEDETEEALKRYMDMHDFLIQGEKKTNKLLKNEKKLIKETNNYKKKYGIFVKSIELKAEKRIDQETFDKDLKKNIKNVKKSLKKLSKIQSETNKLYQIASSMFENSLQMIEECGENCDRNKLLTILDSTNFASTLIKNAEKKFLKKKYSLDLSKVNVEKLSDQQQQSLMLTSISSNNKKVIDNKNLQKSILNLSNNNFPVNEYIAEFENNNLDVNVVEMSFSNLENMKVWTKKDWANSWRGKLPDELQDDQGNLVKMTTENINDLKAQLAINSFNEIITNASNFESEMNQTLSEIVENQFDINEFLNQDWTVSLDNYSKLVGSAYGIEINNFANWVKFYNEEFNKNYDHKKLAQSWKNSSYYGQNYTWSDIASGVDLLSQVNSFEAAQVARSLGTSLQQVADTIAEAAAVGIGTDLEQAAAGLGYGSFADAVAAYNAQYGTNYTPEEAAEALGN
tara:strand:- start:70 stop:2064 length:1995 start_codon:yes stop_codon:yes gene_type:complete